MDEQKNFFQKSGGASIWCRKMTAWLVFFLNVVIAAVAFFVIKDKDKSNSGTIEEKSEEVVPVDQLTLDAQRRISSDREEKLRDLNTSPKEGQADQVTTETEKTTTQPTPAPAPTKPPAKTKTS